MADAKKPPHQGSIAAALALFQSECPAIKKDSTVSGKFSYKYGSLPHILEEIKPHMKKAGLAFSQPLITEDGTLYLKTILYHAASGETLEGSMKVPEYELGSMNVIQSLGAIISYIRRYSILAILGIVPEEEDTDAAGAVNRPEKSSQAPTEKGEELPWLNPKVGGKLNPTWAQAVKYLAGEGKMVDIKKKYRIGKANEEKLKNESMAFDDLPFDRQTTEEQERQAGAEFDEQIDNPDNY